MDITTDIKYIGVNDYQLDLFEGQYKLNDGVKYNSYLILDDKIAIIDSVDINFFSEWILKIKNILKDKKPTYLIIHHMEPDHSSSLKELINIYKDIIIVSTLKSFDLMKTFYGLNFNNKIIINNLDKLKLGKHNLIFYLTPMVHWPEVMMSYDEYDKVLFSADAFGKFGISDDNWIDEARRYYFGIIAKYGNQVNNVLKIIKNLDVKYILSLHGKILKDNIPYYLDKYEKWSKYNYEDEGVVIVYASMYGNTKKVSYILYELLKDKNINVVIYDAVKDDLHLLISEAFKYKTLVIASPTYNLNIFPKIREFIYSLIDRNYQNRNIGLIENGSWSALSNKLIKDLLKDLKNINILKNEITIYSSFKEENLELLNKLVSEIEKEKN